MTEDEIAALCGGKNAIKRVRKAMAENNNCCGSGPHMEGVVKVYKLGGGANLILCIRCWARENQYRYNQGKLYNRPADWPQLDWDKAEVYES